MVRKVSVLCVCLVLIVAFATPALADTHQVYDGSISSTYVTYFRDIVSGLGFTEHYIAFRSGDSSYTMVTGDLSYQNGVFNLNKTGKIYTFSATGSNYNNYYKYNVSSISNFQLSANDSIIYSDLGDFPQLVSRGEKYEILTTFLLCVALLGLVAGRLLRHS